MRVILSLLLLSALSACNALITHRHIGALNQRLQEKTRQDIMASRVEDLPEQYMTQILDHYDNTNPATWQQRYFVNDTVWDKTTNSPVFLMLGGEGPISPAYVNGHFMINNYAEEHHALVVALEHRFYGKSVPDNDSSLANLKYLSSQQALADVATFHAYLSKQYNIPASSIWVSFGGSYSGNLSAWLRLKYPHLIAASFAASAPILAQLDFPEYFEVVAASIGDVCQQKVKRGYNAVEQLLQSGAGRSKLQTLFNTCTPIVTDDDVATFLSDISNPYASVVQYNNDNRNGQVYDVVALCQQLESIDDDLTALAVLNSLYTNKTTGPICMEVSYAQYIKDLSVTSDGRSWTFQTCTEFGYYQTGETSKQPFPSEISLPYFLKQCADIFGVPNFTPRIDFTNEYYGAKTITLSNTFFTNGNIDPWHILGLLEDESGLGERSTVVYMNGTAHCADMYPADPRDVPDLTAVRIKQRTYLSNWLNKAQALSQ